jgi:hypothetical protein
VQNSTDARRRSLYNARIKKKTDSARAVKGVSMTSNLQFPEWQMPYLEALMETNQHKLVGRVDLAETAILLRLNAMKVSSESRTEEQALEDALSGLSVLRRETVEFKKSQPQSLNTIQAHVN